VVEWRAHDATNTMALRLAGCTNHDGSVASVFLISIKKYCGRLSRDLQCTRAHDTDDGAARAVTSAHVSKRAQQRNRRCA
jgi:hypothetical protein